VAEETLTIVVPEPLEERLVLRGLGWVTVRSETPAFDSHMRRQARRPFAVNYRAFANVVLARSIEPCTRPDVVDGLPTSSRRRLMLAVVRLRGGEKEWRSLYGSYQSLDERFFAVTLWRWTEEREQLIRRLRERRRQLADRALATGQSAREAATLSRASGLPQLSALSGVTAALDQMRGVQRMLATSSALSAFSHASALETGLGRSAIRGFADSYAGRSLAVQDAGSFATFRDSLRAITGAIGSGASRAAPPPGFASVLRPYASNPYAALGSGESFRSSLVSQLGLSSLANAASKESPLATWFGRGPVSAATFRFSDSLRDALLGGNALSALTGAGAPRWPVFSQEALGQVVTARIGEQLKAALQRPLFDGRTQLLVQQADVASMFPALRALPRFEGLTGFRDVLAPLRELGETLAELGEFMRVWEDDPLWFLLSVFGMRAARRFAGLTRDEVEEALLAALAEVVTDGEFVAALRHVLREAPHLTSNQRAWLDHGLEHAAAGDWVQAVPQMLLGLEGALHRAAVGKALVVDQGGKVPAAEKLVKQMAMSDEYTAFLVRRVFGGIGNAFRHGRADSGERDQVLFAVVAVAGWVDYFLELNSMGVLADELAERLDGAIARVSDLTSEIGASA
jgi:hypothetical protein